MADDFLCFREPGLTMHRLITLIWLLIAPPLWSELYVSPSSAYFGHVPAGYEELREIRVCGDIISRDNLQLLQISDPELNDIFQIIDQSWKNECLFLTIRFHPDSRQLFVTSRSALTILAVSGSGNLKEVGRYDFSEPELSLRSSMPVWLFRSMVFNPLADRAYFSVNLLEGGFLMFDQLENGLTRYIQEIDE